MNKKAVELAMNTIIIAIMSIIVLVVLIMIFTGKASLFNSSTSVCGDGAWSSWQCVPEDQKDNYAICNSAITCSEGEVCCQKSNNG